jgi:NAD(P) transhydrogenase subunit alpha
MVYNMKPGSVIVDLAAEAGGNCKLTERNKVVEHHGVTLIGYTDLPSRLATQSSQLFATNLRHLIAELTPNNDGQIVIDMDDEVIRGCTVVKDGEITWPPPAPRISLAPSEDIDREAVQDLARKETKPAHPLAFLVPLLLAAIGLFGLGLVAPPAFMGHLTVFVLSCFIGYMVIWGVSHSLHTPLMSVTNAISSIIVIGALMQVSTPGTLGMLLATAAIFITSINIVGGFAVTQRMLRMFRK